MQYIHGGDHRFGSRRTPANLRTCLDTEQNGDLDLIDVHGKCVEEA